MDPRPEGALTKSARLFLGAAIAGLGVLGLIYGDFALVWQRIPIAHAPGRTAIAYACAALELVAGLGLLFRRTARLAAGILFPYLTLWVVLLKLPAVVAVPQMEATWLGFGEIAVLLAGGWVLFVTYAGPWERSHLRFVAGAGGVEGARVLFALSLPMIGLAHFVYGAQTAEMVPHWLPFRLGWAYLTGAGNIAAGLGVLFAVWPRLAATLEAWMLIVITVLVWGAGVVAAPTDRTQWTGFFISSAIASGAWAVAASYRGTPWLGIGKAARAVFFPGNAGVPPALG
jgi:uncharacterized membrane protein